MTAPFDGEPQYPTTPPSPPPPPPPPGAWAPPQAPAPQQPESVGAGEPGRWAATGAFDPLQPLDPNATPPPGATTPGAPSRRLRVAVVAGLVVLGGGATAAALSAGGGSGSGAATPEDAAAALVSAVEGEDVIGVFELLPPGEREALVDTVEATTSELSRLGIVGDSFRLDGVAGVSIDVEDPQFDVDEVLEGDGPDDGLAVVTLEEAEVTTEVDGDAVRDSLGQVLEDLVDANGGDLEVDDSTSTTELTEDDGVQLVFVEVGGRWHWSLAYTITLAGTFGGLDGLDLDDVRLDDPAIEAEGGDDPRDAVQRLLDAIADLDGRGAVAVLDPAELGAVQALADELGIEGPADDGGEITAELTSAEVDDLGGGVSRVVPTGFRFAGDIDEGTFDIELDGDCVRIEVEPSDPDEDAIDEEFCSTDDLGDGSLADLGEAFEDIEVPDELNELAEAFRPLRAGIVTVERDGQHFVSPFRTLVDIGTAPLRGLERADLEEGGIVFELLSGGLDDELETFVEEVTDAFEEQFDTGEQFDPIDDFDDFEPIDDVPLREPTGASGPAGELLLGDVVEGAVALDETASFTVVVEGGSALIGAQGLDGFDGVLTVIDPATGAVLDENDDFIGVDPEVLLLDLEDTQTLVVEVRGFAGDGGSFLLYVE